jgi:hypothetical protein
MKKELALMRDKEAMPEKDAPRSGPGEKELKELLIALQHALVQGPSIALQHALVHMRSNWDDLDRGTS